jgi:hypothetical protein
MRRVVVFMLAGCLMLATLPTTSLAGDTHAVRNRWIGVGIAASVLSLGGLLLGGVPAPVVAAPAPIVYSPPPMVYSPPPVVYVAPPPVVYAPPPVVVYRGWGPPGHYRHHHR